MRFMVDDAGSLIDLETRDMFDIVEEVCPVLNKLVDENDELKKQVKELNQYCTACDDTLTTIQELTYKLLTVNFADTESKADYCHLLNELDNKDLSFIHDCIKAINKCDLKMMEQLKRECGDGV